MTSGVRLAAALAVFAVGLALAIGGNAVGSSTSKIDTLVLRDTAGGTKASFLIHLSDQADLSAAYRIRDQNARGWYVYRALREHALRSQAPIRALLEARNASYRPYWAANVIATRGDRQLVEELARRADVSAIESNDRSNWLEGEEASGRSPATVEPGVTQVRAPQVWALGHTGQGIVIGNQDTGMRWTHNALKPHYRGWNGTAADHNYNWHDSIHSGGGICGANSLVPCEWSSHGSMWFGVQMPPPEWIESGQL